MFNTFLYLDLTLSLFCRRVAAVSFLSNIAHGDSKTLRLDCLQNTEVEDFEINPPSPKLSQGVGKLQKKQKQETTR